jgi:dTDP-glucose pyrophosphorylase
MKSDVDGLLLAAGKSTRTAPYFVQKCAVEVLFNDKVKTVLQHQIDMLMPVVKRLYVVVWWQKEMFGRLNGVRVLEYEPRGIADVWQRFLNEPSAMPKADFILSVNADDLHLPNDYEMLASKEATGVSVFFTKDKALIDNCCAYEVDKDMNVVRVLGKRSGLRRGWIGTGCYLLERRLLKDVRFDVNKQTGEVEPDDVLKQLLEKGKTVKAYPVKGFVHVGDVDVLSRLYKEAVRMKTYG